MILTNDKLKTTTPEEGSNILENIFLMVHNKEA